MPPDILTLENYAFELLNQLYDEFGVSDRNGEIARAIATENDPAGLQAIITALQTVLLQAMASAIKMLHLMIISFSCFVGTPEIKDLLERWAKEDDLSMSQIMRQIIKREARRREQPQVTPKPEAQPAHSQSNQNRQGE